MEAMNDLSGHNGVVTGVEHSRSVTRVFKSSVVTLQDGSQHRFDESGYRGTTRMRELDHLLDVSKARRLLILWVLPALSRWKCGDGHLCLGRLWFQTTAPTEIKTPKTS